MYGIGLLGGRGSGWLMGCRGGGKWVVAFLMGNAWNAVMAWDERLIAGIDWLRMAEDGIQKASRGMESTRFRAQPGHMPFITGGNHSMIRHLLCFHLALNMHSMM